MSASEHHGEILPSDSYPSFNYSEMNTHIREGRGKKSDN